MRHSQSSLIELLIISVGVSVALILILSLRFTGLESIRGVNSESEEVLMNYLDYKTILNETNTLIISHECSNQTFFMPSSFFFNETIRVIESLNNNNSFIILLNFTNNAWTIYNKQESVCLREARLANIDFETNCGKAKMTYGSWTGEASLTC